MITKTGARPPRQHHSRSQGETERQRLFSTKNDLPEQTRTRLVGLLNARLADSIDLQTQCKQAHWNVKGPSFIALHKLFDDINTDVQEYVDLLAERVVQLGGVAEGTARCAAERSTLREYPADIFDGQQRAGSVRRGLPAGDRAGGRAGRCRHGGYPDGNLPRCR
jgi:starvation-inducible DNA-binding protein